MSKSIYYNLIKILILLFMFFSIPMTSNASKYISRGYFVIDLQNKIEWLTCPIGMNWSNKNCIGKAIKLDFNDVKKALVIANNQLKGKWRLPNRKELESLVCKKCKNIKINLKIFPNTPAEPFWTGEKNIWQPENNWIVNFYNGQSFGRYPNYKPHYSRFVRDRK